MTMGWIPVAALLLGVILLAAVSLRLRAHNRRLRRRLERYRFMTSGPKEATGPIPSVELASFDAAFEPGELGIMPAAEVRFLSSGGRGYVAGTTDLEAWILCVLARNARQCFEFGTCTGRTTYLLARNCAPEGRVATITLAPEQQKDYSDEALDDPAARVEALEASRFTSFYYSRTPAEPKIEQLFGDSKRFDESPYVGRCDLVFVDGSHAYSYVVNDSEKALRMLRPGGVVLWHDYRGPDAPKTVGVFQALGELAERLPLVHLARTSLVGYRRPATGGG